MDQEQLRKAVIERTKLEYLLDGQWVPAEFREPTNISLIDDTRSQNITIQLSNHSRDGSGIIPLSEGDIEQRLLSEGAN